ncbi:MAG: glycerate kinase [Clostridia bacterium]|nr:glycerate kinase [Clostridia bacterium]
MKLKKQKKIIIAPDSFKGTMTAVEVCDIIEKAARDELLKPEIIKIPIADGGEGTVDAFLSAAKNRNRKTEKVFVTVKNPFFEEINASFGLIDDFAVIEMAEASGLTLVKGRENPLLASSYGTGQLIKAAIEKGARHIILGIGGSATNDGGIGIASALGVRFTDEKNNEISLNGEGLSALSHIFIDKTKDLLKNCTIEVLCDVSNPLYGENGAAYIYAPQKGANAEAVKRLDQNLRKLADITFNELKIDINEIKGGGAAGGAGAGLYAFLNAKLKRGIDIILDFTDFKEYCKDADLIITGEGCVDSQSLNGKVVYGVTKYAMGVPVVIIAGAIGSDAEKLYDSGVSAIFSTNTRCHTFEQAKETCRENLYFTARNVFKLYNL